LAREMKADHALDPSKENIKQFILDHTNGAGVDVVCEMSGNVNAIKQGFDILRFGGRVSLLGTPTKPIELNLADAIIFKGAVVHGIHGRRMYKTWYQMQELVKAKRLDLTPTFTDRIALKDFSKGMDKMRAGLSSKVLVYPNGVKP
jgi:threonine 3-dehydrogenase